MSLLAKDLILTYVGLLTFVFVVLRISGSIDLPWAVVIAPLVGTAVLYGLGLVAAWAVVKLRKGRR